LILDNKILKKVHIVPLNLYTLFLLQISKGTFILYT